MDTETTPNERNLTQKLKIALLAHFISGVPIMRLGLSEQQKNMVARVEHVYWQYLKNPFLNVHAMFYEMAKQHYKDGYGKGRANACNYARFDEKVFQFVLDNSKPPSRKDREMKVRFAADRLMQRGLATDNDRALAKGAEISIKIDHLDQPESEQADMSRLSFLPPVVTTSAKEVDETKEDMNDAEMKRIMNKYGGFVDEKEGDIEKMVETMAARGKNPLSEEENQERNEG
ncbi:MAG: hypothetical protein IJR86_07560 [Bacteroidaceae bacterium]|nr:hypothetical protein [Bacteroidaceae bacterium]